MTPAPYHIRRATLDDLPELKPLWESMRLPVDELEKRLTEFQVVETRAGEVAGAVGFRMSGRNGCIHSESFSDFSVADSARPLFWDRFQVLASNHGIARLWTQDDSPFWKRNGFQPPTPEILKNLPEAWRHEGRPWLTLQLKSEEAFVSLEKELAVFMQSEKARTEKMFQHARMLKTFATLLAIMLAIVVIGAMIFLVRKNGGTLLPPR
jgi:N-acetylglutamate synthase-like GNAT family acetyltransferase